MSDNQLEVTFDNHLDDLEGCCLAVNTFLEAQGVDESVADSARLVLEELVGTTIRYCYQDDAIHEIVVTLTVDPDLLEMQIEEDAAFSPLGDQGGGSGENMTQGLDVVRRTARDVQYHRVAGRNVTVVEIDVP